MTTAPRPEARTPVRGLENVVAGQTRISHVDGVNGLLIYNGYDVHDLAQQAIFAAARTAGWLAHAMEQYADNRLIRPTSNYTGGWGRTVVPIGERG